MPDPLSVADEAIAMRTRRNLRDDSITVSITLKGGIGPDVEFDLQTFFDDVAQAEAKVRKMRRWLADHLEAAIRPYLDAWEDG